MVSRVTLFLAAVAAALQIALLWASEVPLGVPGEWTWDRIPFSAEHYFGWLYCLIMGAVYLAVVAGGLRRITAARLVERVGWLCALATCGMLWLLTLTGATPEPAGLGRAPFVLFYPGSAGYYWQARFEVTDLGDFLSGYEQSIQDSSLADNYLHLGTHPPGLIVAYWCLWQWCDRSEPLRQIVLSMEPAAVKNAFEEIVLNSRRSGLALDEGDEATLWLAALITGAAVSLTVIPLFASVTQTTTDAALGWTFAALWPLVPSIALFFPKSDLLYPVLAVGALWLWMHALERHSLWAGLAAALLLLGGMLLSLALLPVAALFGLQTLIVVAGGERPWKAVGGAALGVVFGTIVVSLAGGMNLPGIWWRNIENHAAFYDYNSRSYVPWLLVNPLELFLSLGGPLSVVILCGAAAKLRSRAAADWRQLAAIGVWALLWLSGKNMGEAARLWCFLMPLLMWSGASAVRCDPSAVEPAGSHLPNDPVNFRLVMMLIALQMLVCVATVTRVDGFHLSALG